MNIRGFICLFSLATALPVAADGWDPVYGSYYELSTFYSVRSYRPLSGTRDAVFTGLHLHGNNGIIGTHLLTLAVDREDAEPAAGERTTARGETDLRFYFSALGGDAGGFDWRFYLGAFDLPGRTVLKTGLGLGMVHGVYRNDAGMEGKWSSFTLGIPLRFVWRPWPRYLRITGDVCLNFLSMFSRDRSRRTADGDEILFAPSPASLGVEFSPLERMLLYGGVMLPGGDEGISTGLYGGTGVRF